MYTHKEPRPHLEFKLQNPSPQSPQNVKHETYETHKYNKYVNKHVYKTKKKKTKQKSEMDIFYVINKRQQKSLLNHKTCVFF